MRPNTQYYLFEIYFGFKDYAKLQSTGPELTGPIDCNFANLPIYVFCSSSFMQPLTSRFFTLWFLS